MKILLTMALGFFLTSCASRVPAPEATGLPTLGPRAAQEAWAEVLSERVDASGRIDFEGLRSDPETLALVVGHIAEQSPESHSQFFPTRESAIAWWCDAYNALAMWNVLYSGVLPKAKIRFFGLRKHKVGGRDLTLYELENDVIRKLGDERIHFALNCMVRDCPRLPRESFQSGDLNERLDAATAEFLNDPRRVQVTTDAILLSPILDWYEADFLAAAPSLTAYVNRYRTEPVPEDLPVRFLDYDWTLNGFER